jgi:hypothetical protein
MEPGTVPEQAGGDDTGIVQDQQVAWAEEL